MQRLLVATTLSLAACSGEPTASSELHEVASLKAIPNPNLDILFVVDNSVSMADQQAGLAANFPRMMDVLAQLDYGLPNLHIGVITSDMGTTGSATPQPGPSIGQIGSGGCTGTGGAGALQHANAPGLAGSFISDIADASNPGSRIRNYSGELRDVFSQIAIVGDTGCGFEQHLSAMRASFGHPDNAGFLRPDANLAIVIIADEDDCSVLQPSFFAADDQALGQFTSYRCTRHGLTCDSDLDTVGIKTGCVPRADSPLVEDVHPFVDALLELKSDARTIMVAGIVGDPTNVQVELRADGAEPGPALAPACLFIGPGGEESAAPAVRLAAFLDAFPGRSQLTSICSADLSAPLAMIGDSAKKLVGDPCLDTAQLADTSERAGIQPACEVYDIRDSDPGALRPMPACGAGDTGCFELVADPIACPASSDHLRVKFRRASVTDDTWTSVRCQLR